jgi:hypothetical protein
MKSFAYWTGGSALVKNGAESVLAGRRRGLHAVFNRSAHQVLHLGIGIRAPFDMDHILHFNRTENPAATRVSTAPR